MHLFADGAYDRRQMLDKAAFLDFVVEIVCRSDPGFAILPKRWVFERTFGWLARYRLLVRDYEARVDVFEAMIYAAMTNSLICRIVHPRVSKQTLKAGCAMQATARIQNELSSGHC